MSLKRTDFSPQEIMRILEGFRMDYHGKIPKIIIDTHNEALESAISEFYDLTRPENECGALAWDTENKWFVHIGPALPAIKRSGD